MNRKPLLIPLGEDRKVEISLSNLPENVTMENLKATFTFSAGFHSVEFTMADIHTTEDGEHYLALDTSKLAPGDLKLSAHIRIPDEDFADNYRDEYPEFDLNAVIVQR